MARLALIVVVGALAVLGGRQFVGGHDADAHSSTATAIVASAVTHGPQAVADRPASRTALFAVGLFVLTLTGLALGRFGWTAAPASTDRRMLATTLGLEHRRRGPPPALTV